MTILTAVQRLPLSFFMALLLLTSLVPAAHAEPESFVHPLDIVDEPAGRIDGPGYRPPLEEEEPLPSYSPVAGLQIVAFPYNQADPEDVIQYPGAPNLERGFSVRYAQFGFKGSLGPLWTGYILTAGAVAQPDGSLAFGIENARIDLNFESGPFQIYKYGLLAGAQKIPFSRQSLNSRVLMQFPDRSTVVQEMDIRRDVGLVAYGRISDQQETWRLDARGGVFNGRGNRIYAPDVGDGNHYVGRLQLDVFAPIEGTEGDFRDAVAREQPQLSVGISALHNEDLARNTTAYGGDLAFNWHGVGIQAEYIHTSHRPDDGSLLVLDDLADRWETSGWYVQGGYYIIPERLETAVRYDAYNVDILANAAGEMDFSTVTFGVNWHLLRPHRLIDNTFRLKTGVYYTARHEGRGVPSQANDTLGLQLSMYY